MKCLIANNFKMNISTAHDLVVQVKAYNIVDGFEIYIDYKSDNEIKFLHELAFECHRNNLWFQVHGDSSVDLDMQKEFLLMLNEESNILGYPIKVVLHPLTRDTVSESLTDSNLYFNEILSFIDNNKLNIKLSIENLNSTTDLKRLNMFELEPILCNNESLLFTYDIGHALVEYEDVLDLPTINMERLDNIHLHTFINGVEHRLIDKNKIDCVNKAINYIKYLKYDKTIVFEYDFYQIEGNTYNEKLNNYLHSIEKIRQNF